MKSLFAFGLLPFLLILGFLTPMEEEVTKEIASSQIDWKGYKVTGSHTGTVDLKDGSLKFDEKGNLTGGKIVMDMTSITVTDLTGEYKGKLEGHLKSDDFFGIANHPTATLVIKDVAAKGTPGDYKVTGDLTIKDQTKEIKFYANVVDNVATAELKIDRSEYNVRYGSGSFFDGLGDKTIYDEFDINVKLMLK